MAVYFFGLHKISPILVIQMLFSTNSTGPRPRLQKGRKIPVPFEDDIRQSCLNYLKYTDIWCYGNNFLGTQEGV